MALLSRYPWLGVARLGAGMGLFLRFERHCFSN
jgi:hypothetical protein